jgi:hypothetical protein
METFAKPLLRHCERSEAIQARVDDHLRHVDAASLSSVASGWLRSARNDDGRFCKGPHWRMRVVRSANGTATGIQARPCLQNIQHNTPKIKKKLAQASVFEKVTNMIFLIKL